MGGDFASLAKVMVGFAKAGGCVAVTRPARSISKGAHCCNEKALSCKLS